MKKILLFVLSIFIIIGGSGCMKKSVDNYKSEIGVYLEQKYNEDFVIENMTRIKTIGEADVISAVCYSEKYPQEKFDVKYHLDIKDICNSDEIIELLKRAEVYDENSDEWESDVEPYFEDNYSNILHQHQFDSNLTLPDGVKICTKITTPNYFPSAEEGNGTLEEYCQSDNYDVCSYHYVFLKDEGKIDEQFINKNIVKPEISIQRVKVFYVNDIELAESDFYKNYQTCAEFFDKAPYVRDSIKYVYYDGIKQD